MQARPSCFKLSDLWALSFLLLFGLCLTAATSAQATAPPSRTAHRLVDHAYEQPPGGEGPVNYYEVKVLLAETLLPAGKNAKIGALLKNKGYLLDIHGPAAGTDTVKWYLAPQTAKHEKTKPVLMAAGQVTFQARGARKLFLVKLTDAGRQLLKHATTRVKLMSKGAFAVKDGLTVKETASFGVER